MKTPDDLATGAATVLEHLKELATWIPIDDAIPPKQLHGTRVQNRVPFEAMVIAAAVLTEHPDRFPQFDPEDARAAIAYERAIAPIADAAQAFANRLKKSLLKRRAAMAHQTLALYQVMKGTASLAEHEETRTQVKQMAKLLTTRRPSRETEVTQKEVAALVKSRRSAKKHALAQAKADEAATALTIASAQAALTTSTL